MATVDKSRIKTDNNGREYIVVIKGDTLWDIAVAKFGDGTKYPTLAKINNLRDPDYIVVGQTIYLTAATSGGTSSSTQDVQRATITQFGLLSKEDSNELYATWTWPKTGDTDHYEVEWRYKLAIWIYVDSTTDRLYSTYTPPTNSAVKEVQFRVRPIPKEDEQSNGTKTKRFSATWSEWKSHAIVNKPNIPSGLSVTLDGLKLNVSLDNVEASMVEFELIKDNSDSTAKTSKWPVSTGSVSGTFTVVAGARYKVRCRAYKDGVYSEWSSYSSNYETMPAAVTLQDPVAKSISSIYVEWSSSATATKYKIEVTDNEKGFVDGASLKVSAETNNTNYTAEGLTTETTYHFRVKAANDNSQESEWSEVKTGIIAKGPIAPTTWSSTTTAVIGDDENVYLYWSHNTDDGSSQTYAEVILQVEGVDIGTVKSDVTAEIGTIDTDKSDMDGSVKVEYEDDTTETLTNAVMYHVKNSSKDSEKDKTHALIVNTKNFANGAKINWMVRTAGLSETQGAWSVSRTVEIYNTPSVYLTVRDSSNEEIGTTYYVVETVTNTDGTTTYQKTPETITPIEGAAVSGAFVFGTGEQVRMGTDSANNTVYFCIIEDSALGSLPLKVSITVDEVNTDIQYPIGYQLTICSTEVYDTVDNMGDPKIVNTGDVLYSKYFNQPIGSLTPLNVNISAEDVSLENGQTYMVKCTTAMSSGITVESTTEIEIAWTTASYQPNAEIGINAEIYSAYIRPYCSITNVSYKEVTRTSLGNYYVYRLTDNVIDYVFRDPDDSNTYTTLTGEAAYKGITGEGTDVFYSIVETVTPVTSVLLSVYRREYDGSFTEIIKDLDGALNSFVDDPHPALDYARYRIVAKDKSTSMVTYYDVPNVPVGEKAIIIQWDEPQSTFEATSAMLDDNIDRSQSLLRLPYNIDISDKREPEVSLIKYIGRKHPVSYYGTQLGETATWNTEIPKHDRETIYSLRRLSSWTGDVYVREPYGTGYWANVKVDFGRKHLELTIPVTISITRVEGGK